MHLFTIVSRVACSSLMGYLGASLHCINDGVATDPACGTAGFLVSAAEYIRRHYENTMTSDQWKHFDGPAFTGFDTDRTMLRISAMNLMLHSINNPEIDYKDSVSKQNEISDHFTVCLANPPFKGTIDVESINDNLKAVANTKKNRAFICRIVPPYAEKGRSMRLYCAGRCTFWIIQGTQGYPQRTGRKSSSESSNFHALRCI